MSPDQTARIDAVERRIADLAEQLAWVDTLEKRINDLVDKAVSMSDAR